MTPETQIYAYRIPDKYFLPHTVKRPFYAKVTYVVDKGEVKIKEVGLSMKCLQYINNTAAMKHEMECEFDAAVKKAMSLNGINTTIASVLAPFI